jgi:hypothetical protein
MPEIDRPIPPMNADERATLEGWLDFYRATLATKCAGLWQREVAQARANCADRGLDEVSPFMGGGVTLRWIYTHMIGEYARHNGHADLIRERVDGGTGV